MQRRKPSGKDLNERQERVLYCVVKEYIIRRTPVSSSRVLEVSNIKYSSATIRNDMKKLEYLGYLYQPHTSAGRVPTDKGYRFYVDSIKSLKENSMGSETELDTHHTFEFVDPSIILKRAAKILAYAFRSVVAIERPRREYLRIQRIILYPLTKFHVLMTVLTELGLHVTRVVKLPKGMDVSELNELAEMLNKGLFGKTLDQVKKAVSKYEPESNIWYDHRAESIFHLMFTLVEQEMKEGFEKDGLQYMIGCDQLTQQDLKGLSSILSDDGRLRDLVERLFNDRGVKIYIGSEHGVRELRNYSMVLAGYRRKDRIIGKMLVILPKAVPYEKVLGYTEYMANRLTEFFSSEEVLR